jgi:hypothetical protein
MEEPSFVVAMVRQYLQEFGRFKKSAITGSDLSNEAEYQCAGN